MAEVQDRRTPTVNDWQYRRVGHQGIDYSGMSPDEFPDGMTLNVSPNGVNPHDFARAAANERNLQNAWELTTLRAQTAQKAAQANAETGRAVQAEIGAAIAWEDVKGAKINLETARVNTEIAATGLNIRRVELEVVEYQEQIAIMAAPVRKANFLIQALNVQEQFYASAAQLVEARTNRDTNLAVLGIQGVNVSSIPAPDIQSLPLPTFNLPTLDQVLSQSSSVEVNYEEA